MQERDYSRVEMTPIYDEKEVYARNFDVCTIRYVVICEGK